MSGGGLVRRGGYLCECDDGRWVRVFGPARELVFFQAFGDGPIDAPEWIPAGAMFGIGVSGIGQRMCLRGEV